MSSALLKYATKKTAKPTAVVAEPVAAASSGPSILGGGDGGVEAGGLGVKIADVSSTQSTLTEEEEFKRKREQDAARAQFHAARASAKTDSDSSPIAPVASVATPASAPEPAPAPAPAPAAGGWRSRTAAAAQASAPTPAPVTTAPSSTSGKPSWRDREAAKSTVGPSAASGAPVVSRGPAPALTQESFPTLGGASSTGPKPVVPKASAWGKVEAVKPSAASIVGGYAAAAKPATPSTATAAAAPATPVTPTELGVEFEKLKFTPTLHVTSAQYNAKMEDEIKNLLELQSTAGLVRALQSLGGTREQLTGLVYRVMSLGLDLTDDAKRPFVDVALVELLEARVIGRDNVVDGIVDIVADMDSLLCDVPKAVQYLTVMLRSVVDRKVFPTYELPESVAKAMGVTVDPVAAAAAKAARDAAYGEEDDDDDDYDYYDDVDDEDALQSSLGLTNKNTKAKNKHKRDAE